MAGQPTYKSHFYNPNTGVNWMGESSPTAPTQGGLYFEQAREAYLAGDLAGAGYHLGLSLHYLTDLTQPMHAANYTWLNSWLWGYHTGFEGYMLDYQRSLHPPTEYTAGASVVPADYLKAVATTSRTK